MGLCEYCDSIDPHHRYIESCTINEYELHHSFNDNPGKIYVNGAREWYKNGKLHRETGPAHIAPDHVRPRAWAYEGSKIHHIFYNEEFYLSKVLTRDGWVAIVINNIGGLIWEVMSGDKKFLVVSAGEIKET